MAATGPEKKASGTVSFVSHKSDIHQRKLKGPPLAAALNCMGKQGLCPSLDSDVHTALNFSCPSAVERGLV